MLSNLVTAAAYLYFHFRYFKLVDITLNRTSNSKGLLGIAFILNYALFFVCTMLQLNLIFNWVLFFIFLLGETIIYCRNNWRTAFFFTLSGILFGLSINILCRCIISILLNQPLNVFDNHALDDSNMKRYPVFFGFLLGGLAFHLMSQPKNAPRLRTLIDHPEHLSFQLYLMTVMFAYLALNLLLYQSHGNNVLLKLWGIKSCVFSLAGFYLGLRYSLKMCRLSDYLEQNESIQRQLIYREQQEARLRIIAYKDALTGTYNRLCAMDYLQTLVREARPFTLCFIDLDNLKSVNDLYGHVQGDIYLTTVAEKLTNACREKYDLVARFGGDEFLLLFHGMNASAAEERLEGVNMSLRDAGLPFPLSISYGVVESDGHSSADALIDAADAAMYLRKANKHV